MLLLLLLLLIAPVHLVVLLLVLRAGKALLARRQRATVGHIPGWSIRPSSELADEATSLRRARQRRGHGRLRVACGDTRRANDERLA